MKKFSLISIYVISWFVVGVHLYLQICKVESQYLYESENYLFDSFKFSVLNLSIYFGLWLIYKKGLSLVGVTQITIELKLTSGLMSILVLFFSLLALDGFQNEISSQMTKEYNLELMRKTNEYSIYTLEVTEGKGLNLGTGVEVRKEGNRKMSLLGKMNCERSYRECTNLVIKNKEQIASLFSKN